MTHPAEEPYVRPCQTCGGACVMGPGPEYGCPCQTCGGTGEAPPDTPRWPESREGA